MAILSSDVVLVASERMTDSLSTAPTIGGGGARGTAIVQDGVGNNVFPDISLTDRATGRLQARLVYPSVLSANAEALLGAGVYVAARPTDPLVEVCAFASTMDGRGVSKLYDAIASMQRLGTGPATDGEWTANGITSGVTRDSGNPNRVNTTTPSDLVVGDFVHVANSPVANKHYWRRVSARTTSYFEFEGDSTLATGACMYIKADFGTARVSALGLTTAAASATDTTVTVDRTEVRIVPDGATASTPGLVSTAFLSEFAGVWPAYQVGDAVLIEDASTATTYEVKGVAAVDHATGVITLDSPLANSYLTGSKVSVILQVGDLQAQVGLAPFTQQVWARSWADVPTGPSISARYNGTIALTNEGAIEDRWALVFKTATSFDLISERLGQLAVGSTTTDFSPLNPMTNEPYFTLQAAGWTTGWLPGYTLRFNTRAAAGGVWATRCVSQGTASGTQTMTLGVFGSTDA